MSKRKARRFFKPEDKVAIIRRHLLEGTAVSELCEEFEIKPTQYYLWQKIFFERGGNAFSSTEDSYKKALESENQTLKSKLAQKDGIIAEVAEAFVTLKKEHGEP